MHDTPGQDLGEGRENRVLQLGQDEPDQTGPVSPELGRPLVAEHVEGGEHGAPGGLTDAGPAVEHATDGGLADADLLGHLS